MNAVYGFLRIALGWTFLWPFLDKMFGLGFTTCRDVDTSVVSVLCEKAWVSGGSPTFGFLKFATQGPFAEYYQMLAGNSFVDWLFMLGLLGIGVALLLGVMIRVAVLSGVLLLMLMFMAVLPPEHNPFIDEHVIYSLVLLSFLAVPVGSAIGLGDWWKKKTNNRFWLQ